MIYIGTLFEVGYVQYPDGTQMEAKPDVFLYNRATKGRKQATVGDAELIDDEYVYPVTFPQYTTLELIPGVYDLEIYMHYGSGSPREMLMHIPNYAKAILVSASTQDPEESES